MLKCHDLFHIRIMFFFNHSSNRKHFSCLHSLIETREGLGEYETVMQTRDKVEGLQKGLDFSQPLNVYIRLCKYRKKVFYCFYKLPFLRKNIKLFVMALIKREILTSCEVLYTKSWTWNQFLFCKKEAFHLSKKNWHSMFCKDFPSFSCINKVNLLSFQLKIFFKFVPPW